MAMYPCLSLPSLSFPSVSGAVCSFDSQYAGLPLKSHSVAVTGYQSGSGTPSPSNPRAISGWSAITITANSVPIVIQIGSTVYGGEYDARTGVLRVTHEIVEMSSISYNVGFGGYYTGYYANTIKLPDTSANSDLMCSCFAVGDTIGGDNMFIQPIGSSYAGYIIILPSATYQDANAFRNSLQGQYLVYPLKNPTQTIQLPPCPIDTLEGVNNVFADCGDSTIQYPKFG